MSSPKRLQQAEQALLRAAGNEMAAVWRQVSNVAEAGQALQDVLPGLIRNYGQAAAVVAAEWYDEARHVAAVGGNFTALPANLGDQGTAALALWANEKGTSLDSVLTLAQGGVERRILTWSRQTVMGSALADPRADGWQRVGAGSCDFCNLLIGRGVVYNEASADFAAHDHCNCSAIPAFSGRPRHVKPYTPGPRDATKAGGADYARAKEWIAQNL